MGYRGAGKPFVSVSLFFFICSACSFLLPSKVHSVQVSEFGVLSGDKVHSVRAHNACLHIWTLPSAVLSADSNSKGHLSDGLSIESYNYLNCILKAFKLYFVFYYALYLLIVVPFTEVQKIFTYFLWYWGSVSALPLSYVLSPFFKGKKFLGRTWTWDPPATVPIFFCLFWGREVLQSRLTWNSLCNPAWLWIWDSPILLPRPLQWWWS